MDMDNSRDFINFVTKTMESVTKGEMSPAAGNAVANLSGKILQMISLEMRAIDYPKLADRKTLKLEAKK